MWEILQVQTCLNLNWTWTYGLVQGSDICLNRTIGPVPGSWKSSKNRTEPDFSNTNQWSWQNHLVSKAWIRMNIRSRLGNRTIKASRAQCHLLLSWILLKFLPTFHSITSESHIVPYVRLLRPTKHKSFTSFMNPSNFAPHIPITSIQLPYYCYGPIMISHLNAWPISGSSISKS